MKKSKISAPIGFNPKPKAKVEQLQSAIIYRGKSLLDGKPIVVIATYTESNSKTGQTLQTYVLRADVDPITASRLGEDYSICGNCPHRGTPAPDNATGTAKDRTCYVQLFQGSRAVYDKYKRGGYTDISHDLLAIQELGRGRLVRLGSYGDPAIVDSNLWRVLVSEAVGYTGYTHQSGVKGASVDYGLTMVSADSKKQAQGYHLNNKRTFRVIPVAEWQAKGNAALLKTEILCLATKEAAVMRGDGLTLTCEQCKLCSGSKPTTGKQPRSIAIVAHGANRKAIK